jgi:hypothetical protein
VKLDGESGNIVYQCDIDTGHEYQYELTETNFKVVIKPLGWHRLD